MTQASNGTIVLAFNPSATTRRPLDLTTSADGHKWATYAVLDSASNDTYQYPTPIIYKGYVYTTYSADTTIGIRLAITPFP